MREPIGDVKASVDEGLIGSLLAVGMTCYTRRWMTLLESVEDRLQHWQ